jgi:2,3-bisphosphoglycerate-independent phosphoglycerate mutase
MKYIICLGDGMADYPVEALGGRTPLEAADKPYMDYVAQHGTIGLCRTIPEGMAPGSDAANMSVMGFDPKRYYSGRSPLEAVALGVEMQPDDVAFRCNLVCLSDEPAYEDKTMIDYSSDEISTEESVQLIADLAKLFNAPDLQLYPGISYRHCLILNHAQIGSELTPPHDITGKPVKGHLPGGRYGERLLELQKRSYELLSQHPVNLARIAAGKKPANSCWFWGEGTKPAFDTMENLYGIKGGVICAVDLIKGLGLCAGLRNIPVEGATGAMVTNYKGKGEAALQLLKEGCDLVYIHVEAPDECGHHGEPQMKTESIENIDRHVLGFLMEQLKAMGEDFRVLLCPDHPTPIATMTHSGEPIPFVLYDSTRESAGPRAPRYTEAYATASGLFLPEGPMMMQKLISGEF